ncbi:MAG: hypothetical protein WD874_01620 [Parcubacteria group bacterium]
MNPEEKAELRRSLDLSEQNNRMLHDIHRAMRWYKIWGVTKLVLFILPFIFGYVYLKPYFGPISNSFKGASEIMQSFR